MKNYTRKVSVNERLWLLYNQICPPYMNQFVLIGPNEIDIEKFKVAVEKASEANPGSRVILKGFLGTCRWVDSRITPQIREINENRFFNSELGKAPFMKDSLSPKKRNCEILIIHGNPNRIAFRTNHAVMDMRGTFMWMYDIFQALENKPMLGTDSTLSDFELAGRIKKNEGGPKNLGGCIAPTGRAIGNERGFDWMELKIKAQYSSMLGQVALILAKAAWEHEDGKVIFSIPVDLRSRDTQIKSSGNLSLPIFIEIKKDSTVQGISADISTKLKSMQECNYLTSLNFIKHIPLWLLKIATERMIAESQKKGRYIYSGILSNVSKIPLELFGGGGFVTEDLNCIAPGMENIPLFLGTGIYGGITGIGVTIPKVLSGNGRLEKIMDLFARELVPK